MDLPICNCGCDCWCVAHFQTDVLDGHTDRDRYKYSRAMQMIALIDRKFVTHIWCPECDASSDVKMGRVPSQNICIAQRSWLPLPPHQKLWDRHVSARQVAWRWDWVIAINDWNRPDNCGITQRHNIPKIARRSGIKSKYVSLVEDYRSNFKYIVTWLLTPTDDLIEMRNSWCYWGGKKTKILCFNLNINNTNKLFITQDPTIRRPTTIIVPKMFNTNR